MFVPPAGREEARARMLVLFPEGFEEGERGDRLELAAYTDERGEARARAEFGEVLLSEVPDDWEERWKRFHRPVTVGGLWVGPPWDEAPPGASSVVIDPGRAFGTGAHPTTRICIEHLAELPRGSLLDIGCGSGVLSIAAAKLGFAPVYAIDRDEAAIEAAERNAKRNEVEIEFRVADLTSAQLPAASSTVANINERFVAEVAARVSCDRLVTSGYFEPHVPAFVGYRRIDRKTRDGWAADLHVRE